MATKGAVVMVCWLTMVSAMFMGCKTVAGGDETWEEVETRSGGNVVYGDSNTYIIWARDIAIQYLWEFFFGLGNTGDVVLTDTPVTLGVLGDASKIFACTDGKLELVAVNSSGTPQNAIIRVRYNSTDRNYRLQVTENSPAVFVQFTCVSLGGLLCTSGVPGTPIRFISSSSSSSSHNILHKPATAALRQVVNA